jgi:hypothetical protein
VFDPTLVRHKAKKARDRVNSKRYRIRNGKDKRGVRRDLKVLSITVRFSWLVDMLERRGLLLEFTAAEKRDRNIIEKVVADYIDRDFRVV